MEIGALVAIAAAAISCIGAVISAWFVRRGPNAELTADVEELALVVERLQKTNRRERMAAVRRGIPADGDTQLCLDPMSASKDPRLAKIELRRRILGGRVNE